jgi:multidrug efflux pump subunit AcrA (membrane-fusion protein)
MKSKSILLVPAAVIAVGVITMIFLLGMREEQPRRTPQPRSRIVEAREVILGPVAAEIEAYGTVTSSQPVELYSEVSGPILAGGIPFKPAQEFSTGDILLRIDDRQVLLSRQSAISDLLAALASVMPEIKVEFPGEYVVWQRYFDSVEFDRPIPVLPEAANQRIKLYLSRFNVYKLYFSVRDLEIRLEKYTVRAPFDGTIVTAALREGSTARSGSPLGSIISLQDMEVEIPLTAADVQWVDFDKPVSFQSAELEGVWTGRIRRVGRKIQTQTQTLPLYVELEDIPVGALPEGAFFEAEIAGRSVDNAFEIPRRALYDDRFVYVVDSGQLDYREVHLVRIQKYTVIVDGGLEDGDTLVIEPLQGITPGMSAVPRMTPTGDQGP